MKPPAIIDNRLEDWNTLSKECSFEGILIGNGASRAVWDAFQYDSLFETAKTAPDGEGLTSVDVALFETFKTCNFEFILSSLATTLEVLKSLGIRSGPIQERYQSIQKALGHSVRKNHIPWQEISDDALYAIRKEFLKYPIVYTTNYDLLAYWAIMKEEGQGFKDYFWSDVFDITNTEIWGKVTTILFLHGGLQFGHTGDGKTVKYKGSVGENLLDRFGTGSMRDTPLLIAEGNWQEKLRSINRSDYLSFAYSRLAAHKGPLCVFGHSLSKEDQHIVDAIKKSEAKILAISVVSDKPTKIRQYKASMVEKFPNHTLRFFDASTHPLGSSELKHQSD